MSGRVFEYISLYCSNVRGRSVIQTYNLSLSYMFLYISKVYILHTMFNFCISLSGVWYFLASQIFNVKGNFFQKEPNQPKHNQYVGRRNIILRQRTLRQYLQSVEYKLCSRQSKMVFNVMHYRGETRRVLGLEVEYCCCCRCCRNQHYYLLQLVLQSCQVNRRTSRTLTITNS